MTPAKPNPEILKRFLAGESTDDIWDSPGDLSRSEINDAILRAILNAVLDLKRRKQ